MYNRFFRILSSLLLLSVQLCTAQSKLVNVNPATGTANVQIPVYTVSSGQVSLSVNLTYSASGIKPKDVEGSAGMGWNLSVGGQVSREVRGLPDDIKKDNAGNTIYGWMNISNPGANSISGFQIKNDNGVTCSNESADITYINTYFPTTSDTEPDMFNVNAPGLSCQLIYDRTTTLFHPVTFQDLVITYTNDPTSGLITSFTIINDKGIKYVFAAPDQLTQKTDATHANPVYFKNKYLQYQNGITYYSDWKLTTILDPQGNGVRLDYETQPVTMGADSVALYIGGANTYSLQYRTLNTALSVALADIESVNATGIQNILNFYWNPGDGITSSSGQSFISRIIGQGHTFLFNYSIETNGGNFARAFLRSFSDGSAVNTPINYQFGYAGETVIGINYGPTLHNYATNLPDSTSLKRDYWGYYTNTNNPGSLMPKVWMAGTYSTAHPCMIYESNTGSADTYPFYTTASTAVARTADPNSVMTASLNRIVFPNGGSSNIVYESNDYLDANNNVTIQGNGIRVKQLIDSAGSGSTNNIIKNYSYIIPAGLSNAGLSSGEPVSLPEFAFTIPTSVVTTGNSYWNLATAISAYDLSDEDHTIMYQYVKESQTDAGSTLYQYTVPATNFSPGSPPACSGCTTLEWFATINLIARTNCSNTYGEVKNNTFSYPFMPNPNYDFERGLPVKKTNYTDAGAEVSETNYTYQRYSSSSALVAVIGFRYEDNVNGSLDVKTYDKYTLYYNAGELIASVNKKVFDSSAGGTSQSSTVNYSYGSANHRLITQQSSVNSDVSTLSSKTTYVKDYTATAGTNVNINALYNLKQLNINEPVESYQLYTPSGGSAVVTAAALTLFKGFAVGSSTYYLPYQQFKQAQPNGLAIAAFIPFAINTSSQTIQSDPNYYPAMNFDAYDKGGMLMTADDAHKDTVTTIINHQANQPVAVIKNASWNEIAFNDFDSDLSNPIACNFVMSNTANQFTASGSHAGSAYGFGTGETATSPTLKKNPIAQNYVFSIWINAASAGTLTLTLTGISTHPAINYSGGWKYYEIKIPVSTLSSSYTVSFTAGTAISIDDILFYPDVAEVTTVTYDPVTFYKVAATNTNGVSTYYTNDAWGRPTYIYDRDKNIVQKNSYVTSNEVKDYTNLSINAPSVLVNTPVSFSINGVDVTTGATVTWTFGDNSAPVITSLATSPTHTYTLFGTYVVTATVNSPLFGPKTVTASEVVTPANITLNYSNGLGTGAGGLLSVQFVQGGVTKYTYGNYQLAAGVTILQGTYNIIATISNPLAKTTYSYSAVADCWYGCNAYTSGTTLTETFTGANLNSCSTLTFEVSTSGCTGAP